ncbi:rhodanese-like domain-containing protein [Actinokineospora soli]
MPAVTVSDIPADAAIVDVREQAEWDAGHAPGAVHIPMGELAGRLDELPDTALHVICRSGGRSARVTAYLNANGWDAVNVDGGMQSWAAAGRPMASAAGSPEVL